MSRRGEPPCQVIPGGRHSWLDVTTKDDEPRHRYVCQGCRKETLE